jgi:hypothetical protein
LHLYVPGQASPPSDNAPFVLRIFGFLISTIYGVVKMASHLLMPQEWSRDYRNPHYVVNVNE